MLPQSLHQTLIGEVKIFQVLFPNSMTEVIAKKGKMG